MTTHRSYLGFVVLGMLAADGGMVANGFDHAEHTSPFPPCASCHVVATLTAPALYETIDFSHEYGVRAPTDSFTHDRHEAIPCLDCHVTDEGHGDLTFEQPRGCDVCHHRDPSTNDCAVCHDPEDLAAPYGRTFAVTVEDHDPRIRTVDFFHDVHAEEQCIDCHREPVSLALGTESATCQACHEDHHETATQCAQCHRTYAVLDAHTVTEGHADCDECHTPATIALLVPERSFCLVCHEDDVDHYPEKACTVCHLQDDPKDYQQQLIGLPL